MSEDFQELRDRCWYLLSTQGVELSEGGPIHFSTDLISVDLSYNGYGEEFFDVISYVTGRAHNIYQEHAGNIYPNNRFGDLPVLLEHLRQVMVLDDLARA